MNKPKCWLCRQEMQKFTKEQCREFYKNRCYTPCLNPCRRRITWLCPKCHMDQRDHPRNPDETLEDIDDSVGIEQTLSEMYGEDEEIID